MSDDQPEPNRFGDFFPTEPMLVDMDRQLGRLIDCMTIETPAESKRRFYAKDSR